MGRVSREFGTTDGESGLAWFVFLHLHTMSLWPALPTELKRLILELVAAHSDHLARQLRLVSKDINILVLPIIFRAVAIENIHDLLATANTILPPPSKFRKSSSQIPRLLTTYNTAALALLLGESLPSIENALASIGPIFSRLQFLAITSRNLSNNAFWLRQNRVRPKRFMLLHHGSPRPVNWRDPIFSQVTHIFTSSLDSHGCSTLADLPNLTHIAATTRAELSEDRIRHIAHKLEWLLDGAAFPNLRSVVLALDRFPRPASRTDISARERYTAVLTRWRTSLAKCLASSRFYILPDPNPPMAEWDTWINGRPSSSRLFYSASSDDVWSKAQEYRDKYPNSTVLNPREGSFRRYCLDNLMKSVHINRRSSDSNTTSHHHHSNSSSSSSSSTSSVPFPIYLSDDDEEDDDPSYLENYLSSSDHHPSSPSPPPSKRCRNNNKNRKRYTRVEWEIDLVQRDGYRDSDRLDPEENGEFEHVLHL